MAFRNYKKTKPLCLEKSTPSDLDIAIDKVQNDYDIIDLQFSTHYDPVEGSRYCALLLLANKENK